jgi:hypothetical protein
MVESECYISESYEILRCPTSTRKDYVAAFEKLCMQYGEFTIAVRFNVVPLDAKKLIRIIVLLDLLRMKLT